jgi:hypothetical protein
MGTLFKVSTLANPATSDREIEIARPGWAVMRARPNLREHGQVLWADLLHALGHNLDSSERRRASANADIQALCWLAVGDVEDVIVAGANLLPPASLRDLCALTSSQGVRTWLLYDIEVADEREEAEVSLALESIDLEEFLNIRSHAGLAEPARERPLFPTVPDTHFLGFLDMAREIMEEKDLARVTERYQQSKLQMLARIDEAAEVDEGLLAASLHEITVHTNDLNELTAIIKGAQTAAFIRGWHPRVDIMAWSQRGTVAALARHLEPEEWTLIARLYRPCDAATCALSTLGISVDEVGDILSTAVADDGSTVQHQENLIEVPEPTRPLLVAQHLFRGLIGTDSDRFLVHGTKSEEVTSLWAGRLLKLVTRDTGVVLRSHAARRKSIEGATWNQRLGVSITRLAP